MHTFTFIVSSTFRHFRKLITLLQQYKYFGYFLMNAHKKPISQTLQELRTPKTKTIENSPKPHSLVSNMNSS